MSKKMEALAQKQAKLEAELDKIQKQQQEHEKRVREAEAKRKKPRDDRAKFCLGEALLKRWSTSEGDSAKNTEDWIRRLCEETLPVRERKFMAEWMDECAAAKAAGTK